MAKKKKIEKIFSPIEGEIIALEKVPDEIFANKLIGEGFAVKPTGSVIKSPVSGTVTLIPKTIHAVGITTTNGLEVLLHFGINGILLEGEGLESRIEIGQPIEIGEELIRIDLPLAKEKLDSIITPVVVTNLEGRVFELDLEAKEGPIMTVHVEA